MKRKVRTRKLGIKFKILIPVCVCVLVVCVVMGVNSYKHIQDGMVEMGVQEADMAADLTLRMLDGDEVEQIVPGAEESDAYKGVLAALKNMKDSCGIAYLYTLYTDGTNVYYGVDVEATEDVSYLGDPFADSYEELKSVFEGQEYVQDYIDETEDGDLITVYKPITNSAGKVVAVLGLLAFFVACAGAWYGVLGRREEDSYRLFPDLGIGINGLLLVGFVMIYIMGW